MRLYSLIILLILTASSQAQENKKMNKLSPQNLNNITKPNELKQICKSIAALESIISPEWEYRYYSYQSKWSETEECCEMRNGQGDQMLIIFRADETVINGFAHESEMNGWEDIIIEEKKSFFQKIFNSTEEQQTELVQQIWNGVVDELPKQFNDFIYGEPVKSIGTTFCIWQTKSNPKWTTGTIQYPKDNYKDGSSELLELLDGNPFT